EFEFLPQDALGTRMKTQLEAGDGSLDIAQFSTSMAPWAAPQLLNINDLITEYGAEDYEWEDVLQPAKDSFTIDGRLIAAPFRHISTIMHYQPDVLSQAGITAAPTTFAELQAAVLAVTEKFGPE